MRFRKGSIEYTIGGMEIPLLYPKSIKGRVAHKSGKTSKRSILSECWPVAVFNLVAEMRALIDVLAGTRSVNPPWRR